MNMTILLRPRGELAGERARASGIAARIESGRCDAGTEWKSRSYT